MTNKSSFQKFTRAEIFAKNVTTQYDYNGQKKLVKVPFMRMPGFEDDIDRKHEERGTVHDSKLDQSTYRAKSTIEELAKCNDWQYMVTFTLNGEFHDRYDLKGSYSKLSQRIRNIRKKTSCGISYILVPEKHKDGAWHFHGLLNDLPTNELIQWELDTAPTKDIRKLIEKGYNVYNWPDIANKFGFMTLTDIVSKEKVTSYIKKYITKELTNSVKELNAKTYYPSSGLKRRTVDKRGTLDTMAEDSLEWYDSDYCRSVWLPPNIDMTNYIDVKTGLPCEDWLPVRKQLTPFD